MVSGTSPGTPDAGAGLEVAVRDMELAIADLRTRAWVHPTSLATLGFSGAGFSQLLLAMRHPDVQAVCDLESAIFDDRVMWPLSRGWGYDVAALRVPFLHTYGVPLSARENRRADFEAMRYARRYHYLGDAAPRLQAAFETTVRYVRAFMDAHVKGDSAAAAFLTRRPEDNGVPPGLATVRVLAAIEPAPTADGLEAQIRGDGIESALRTLREAAVRDPEAPLFAERALNALGYRLFRDGRHADAVAILQTMLDRYPASPNAYDSLSEVLEAAGRREEARTVVLRGLDVVQAPAVSTGDRDAFTRMLRERLARLDRSGPAPPP
jgi:tetratricopeptide (TPR) repeat protein